jgi:hypothetical protein
MFGHPDNGGQVHDHYCNRHHLEIKSGKRWLIEGNVFENNWAVYQQGAMICLTNRPIYSTVGTISDVVVRDNVFTNGPQVFIIANTGEVSVDPPYYLPMDDMRRIQIHNNLITGISASWGTSDFPNEYFRLGLFAGMWNLVDDVSITHNTFFRNTGCYPGFILFAEGQANDRLVCRDNVIWYADDGGMYGGLFGNVPGGAQALGEAMLDGCWQSESGEPSWAFDHNVFVYEGQRRSTLEPLYPEGNWWESDIAQVGFADTARLDLRLLDTSPYRGKASDGTDPGVNYDILTAMTENVVSGIRSDKPASTHVPAGRADAARRSVGMCTDGAVLRLYTLSGHRVATARLARSQLQWDGPPRIASGIYLYSGRTPGGHHVRGKAALGGSGMRVVRELYTQTGGTQ